MPAPVAGTWGGGPEATAVVDGGASVRARAAEAYKVGDYAAAVEGYGEALREADGVQDRTKALTNRAQCRIKLHQYAEGREDAAAARALQPDNPKAWFRLGVCEAQLGRLHEAEAALAEASALRPNDAAVAEVLADVRARQAEASGLFSWTDVYNRYLVNESKPLRSQDGVAAARNDDRTVLYPLGAEPFVGPVRIGLVEGRGRGLFATENVRAGQLLMCAQAVATGENDKLPDTIAQAMARRPHLKHCVLNLSRGTPDSEVSLPMEELIQLAAPRRLSDDCEEMGAEESDAQEIAALAKEVETILFFNQFGLPRVNANAAPIEVANDPGRSGLWILPAFMNHSCLPNVQLLIVWDCLFLRAGRDIPVGGELFDCYLESLQPLQRRRESLLSYGIRPCLCERCVLEEAVMDPEEVASVIEEATKASSNPMAEAADKAEVAEAAAERADAVVALALEKALQEDWLSSKVALPLPKAPLKARRMAMIREGFEKPTDAAEQESFERQEALHRILLGGLANVLRGHAMSLRGLNRYVDQFQAWGRVANVLLEVIPGSELEAIVHLEALSAQLLATHLDYRIAARGAMRDCLLKHHQAYGGGIEAFRVINAQTFAANVLDGAAQMWPEIVKEFGLPADGYDATALCARPRPVAAAELRAEGQQPRPKGGFVELLKRRTQAMSETSSDAAHDGNSSAAADTPAEGSQSSAATAASTTSIGAARGTAGADVRERGEAPRPSWAVSAASTELGRAASDCGAAPALDTSSVEVGYQEADEDVASFEVLPLSERDASVTVVVRLPGLAFSAEASLEVSEREVRIRSLNALHPHSLDVQLPCDVDAETCAAKWSKRTCQLTLRMQRL